MLSRCSRFAVLTALFAAAAGPIPAQEAEDCQATLKVLRAGLRQWESEVTFKSTFRYRSGSTPSVEDGLAGKIDTSGKSTAHYEATGLYHKMGPMVRLRLSYGRLPVVVQESGSPMPGVSAGQIVTNISFDEVTNGEVYAEYAWPEVSLSSYFRVERHPNYLKNSAAAGGLSHTVQTPLSLFGNVRERMLELADMGNAARAEERVECHELDAEHLEIIQVRKSTDFQQKKRTVLWILPDPPVIEQLTYSVDGPKGRTDYHARLANFVECPGGWVPRQLRFVTKDWTDTILAREWISEDLGNEAPTKEDFVIRVVADTNFINLQKVPPAVGDYRDVDLSGVTVNDLGTPLWEDPPMQPTPPPISRFRVWVVVLNVVGFVAILGWLIWRQFLRGTRTAR